MKKWNLIVDVDNCTNCHVCVLASQDEHVGNDFPGYAAEMPKHGHRWIDIKQKERGQVPMIDVAYLPVMCQHCDAAPCIAAAEGGAVSKRPDGIVIIDPQKARGQKQIVEACPYGAVWWNEEKEIPQHWIFDAHLLDKGWSEPRAAQVCATAAIRAVKLKDQEMARLAAEQGLEPFHPEYETKPRVWYKNLGRFTRCLIGGSVETQANGTVDCLEGAKIVLIKDGEKLQETVSKNFGDFKFDDLAEDSGSYTVEISHDRLGKKSLDVELGQSTYLGPISL
jgi:Fe-S-cluster-containing dehydrogenase component